MNIHISHPENFSEKKQIIESEGYENLHIIADFDRTLTYGTIDGEKTSSLISLLRKYDYLDEDYSQKAKALYAKYHPIEVDTSLSFEKRKQSMDDWWNAHNALLVEKKLHISHLEKAASSGKLQFREGVKDFFAFLYEKNIPIVIMSASGCGDIVKIFFQEEGIHYDNIHFILNDFLWDENGYALLRKTPPIHSLNKDETAIQSFPEIFDGIKNRKNILLLGDSLGDLGMSHGFDYNIQLSIGFLNTDYNKNTEEYRKNFDMVLEGDGDFSSVNELFGI